MQGNIELQEMVGGALQEKFNTSFERVIANLRDPNTPYKNKRSITIKMTFEQNEERDDVKVGIDVSEKLSPQSPMNTNFYIGTDLATGEVVAEEYGKQIRGQMKMDDYAPQQEVNGKVVETDTGEIVEDEKKTETVVDFRKAANAD